MHAECEQPRSNALLIACIIWGAGLFGTLAGILTYVAIQNYDPSVSCDELAGRAFGTTDAGTEPPDIDAWDDWELLCGYYD
jgi:hypothetical protein